MAKSKSKETSLPLIISLVFFVLLSIGLGVFCYVLYSDQETKDAQVAEAKKQEQAARTLYVEAQDIARVQRVYFGVPKDDDLSKVETDIKEGTPAFQELERLNKVTREKTIATGKTTAAGIENYLNKVVEKAAEDTIAKRAKDPKFVGVVPVALNLPNLNFPEDLGFWEAKMDSKTGAIARPTGNMIDVIVRSKIMRDLALKKADMDGVGYTQGVGAMKTATDQANDARGKFTDEAKKFPEETNNILTKAQAGRDADQKKFQDEIRKVTAERTEWKDKAEKASTENARLKEDIDRLNTRVGNLNSQLAEARSEEKDPLKLMGPQASITRRLPGGLVEIDIGSNDRVREGLTFSILPTDYVTKGMQSRMRVVRVPDGRGGVREETVFAPKAEIEVLEVLGPNSSRARITEEWDPVRDAAMPGDLAYSLAWRKGAPEHIALIGIFDVNGDGTDDIDMVVRDLKKMGILVDAYYDPNKKDEAGKPVGGWVGQITDQTRFLVKGYFPDPSISDPNLTKMTDLNGKFKKGLDDGQKSGARLVGIKDFFPRMGYKIRMDVSDDHIRQAARKYLDPVSIAPPMGMNPGNNN